MELIDKAAVVAELEKTYKFHEKRSNKHDSSICDVLYGLSHRIDTIEVKEVDLEKEYEEFVVDDPIFGNFITNDTMGIKLAKHFFELGLKAKGE